MQGIHGILAKSIPLSQPALLVGVINGSHHHRPMALMMTGTVGFLPRSWPVLPQLPAAVSTLPALIMPKGKELLFMASPIASGTPQAQSLWPTETRVQPVARPVSGQHDHIYAVAVCVSLLFRALGYAGALVTALCLALPLVSLVLPGTPAAFLSTSFAPLALGFGPKLALVWLLTEGVFYGMCVHLGAMMSRDQSAALKHPLTSERRCVRRARACVRLGTDHATSLLSYP